MAGYVDDRSSYEKSVGLGHRHPKMCLSITPPCMPRPTKRLATQRRSFLLCASLEQQLGDLVIALFHRLIKRCFPLRVLLVDVRFLI